MPSNSSWKSPALKHSICRLGTFPPWWGTPPLPGNHMTALSTGCQCLSGSACNRTYGGACPDSHSKTADPELGHQVDRDPQLEGPVDIHLVLSHLYSTHVTNLLQILKPHLALWKAMRMAAVELEHYFCFQAKTIHWISCNHPFHTMATHIMMDMHTPVGPRAPSSLPPFPHAPPSHKTLFIDSLGHIDLFYSKNHHGYSSRTLSCFDDALLDGSQCI